MVMVFQVAAPPVLADLVYGVFVLLLIIGAVLVFSSLLVGRVRG
ncbi:MAG: hypothetical protein ABSF83_11680 [Nitrososphaerales archaeon]